ncbi:MAG: CBS domain-containing protein [archaeon]|nr:CBS domain-containing protein [archaeon]
MGTEDLQDVERISILRSQLDSKRVEEIMDTEFPTIGLDERLVDAITLMRRSGYQDIPVVKDEEYLGTVSYGDVLKKKNTALDSKIRNLVSMSPMITKETDITKVAEIMITNDLRQVPVVCADKKKVIGCIGRNHLVNLVAGVKAISDIKVWEVMTSPIESVYEYSTIDEAMGVMRSLDVRTLPVIDDFGKVIGIFGMNEVIASSWRPSNKTIGDISGRDKKSSAIVGSICVPTVKSVKWNDVLGNAMRIMLDDEFSIVPVTDDDKLVGTVAQCDIIELVSACKKRDHLFVQLSGLDEVDKASTSAIYEVVKDEVDKIKRIGSPESLSINISKYNRQGERNKYSMSARLIFSGRVFNAKQVDWDLIKTVNDLVKKLTNAVLSSRIRLHP